MTNHAIVPATSDHARRLSMTMREADRAEVIAQTGIHPALGLGMSMGSSAKSWAGLIDGDVACIWGVSSADEISSEVGVPWMLGSDLVVRHQRLFLRNCHEAVDEMQAMFPVLENFVDVRNEVAIRWLRWLSFDIFPTVPHGPYELPFHPFRRVRG